MRERAGHLPGLDPADVTWHPLVFAGGAVIVEVPVLTGAQAQALADTVRHQACTYLKALSVAQIVQRIDAAVARLLDRSGPWRQKAEHLLPLITGYDREMVRLGLTGYLKTFRAPQLLRFLAEDFPNPGVLDAFQPAPKGGFVRAFGPDLLVHVWAGNTPALPLWSLVSGLLVKAGSIGKVASAEPLFAGWFAQILAEIDPKLGACLAVVWWKGGDVAGAQDVLGAADVVLAYGGTATLSALKAQVPVTTRFLPHGHKISFAMVARSALTADKASATAHRAAHDIARYDQQGCYSPQMLFVERGGPVSPRAFAGYLAHEMDAFARKFPRRALDLEEAAQLAAWRGAQEMHALADASPDGDVLFGAPDGDCLVSAPDGAWSVAYRDRPVPLSPSGLNRSVSVVAVDALDDALAQVAPARAYLQSVGIAAAPEQLFHLAGLLGQAGATRICALGQMTAPEAGWHHDGRFNLLDLVTYSEIELSAEQAAEHLATYAD